MSKSGVTTRGGQKADSSHCASVKSKCGSETRIFRYRRSATQYDPSISRLSQERARNHKCLGVGVGIRNESFAFVGKLEWLHYYTSYTLHVPLLYTVLLCLIRNN
jgi:hypothetical protein